SKRCIRSTESELDVVFLDCLLALHAEPLEQLGDDRGLVLRIAPRPGPRLDLEKVAVCRRVEQTGDLPAEKNAAVDDQPAATILLDLALARRLKVLAVEARRVRGRRQEPRSKEQHRAERRFARWTGQRQPRPGVDDLALLVQKLVLAVAQPALA